MPKRDPVLKARSRSLRTNQTPAETASWRLLRAHQLDGVKFVRQHVVGPYILDFAARAHKLAIEVDGDTHGARTGYDAARTAMLEQEGYRVIRFTNAEVLGNPEGVAHAITAALASPSPPLPTSVIHILGRLCPRHNLRHAGGMSHPKYERRSPEGRGL